ncbi:UNVERIFIED_CONTAM: hypothetical protein FKN15_010694 [Acipenser sinensis]
MRNRFRSASGSITPPLSLWRSRIFFSSAHLFRSSSPTVNSSYDYRNQKNNSS